MQSSTWLWPPSMFAVRLYGIKKNAFHCLYIEHWFNKIWQQLCFNAVTTLLYVVVQNVMDIVHDARIQSSIFIVLF